MFANFTSTINIDETSTRNPSAAIALNCLEDQWAYQRVQADRLVICPLDRTAWNKPLLNIIDPALKSVTYAAYATSFWPK